MPEVPGRDSPLSLSWNCSIYLCVTSDISTLSQSCSNPSSLLLGDSHPAQVQFGLSHGRFCVIFAPSWCSSLLSYNLPADFSYPSSLDSDSASSVQGNCHCHLSFTSLWYGQEGVLNVGSPGEHGAYLVYFLSFKLLLLVFQCLKIVASYILASFFLLFHSLEYSNAIYSALIGSGSPP